MNQLKERTILYHTQGVFASFVEKIGLLGSHNSKVYSLLVCTSSVQTLFMVKVANGLLTMSSNKWQLVWKYEAITIYPMEAMLACRLACSSSVSVHLRGPSMLSCSCFPQGDRDKFEGVSVSVFSDAFPCSVLHGSLSYFFFFIYHPQWRCLWCLTKSMWHHQYRCCEHQLLTYTYVQSPGSGCKFLAISFI